MRWVLLDLAIALVALGVLAVLVRRLWRAVKALSAAVADAGDTLAAATDALAAAQAEGPLGDGAAAVRTPGPDPRYERAIPVGPADGPRHDRPRTASGA